MSNVLTRADLVSVLREWQAGRLSATEVQEWAEARDLPGDFEVDDDEDSGSAAVEVLARLDMLEINVITVDDIPPYRELLNLLQGTLPEALERFEAEQAKK